MIKDLKFQHAVSKLSTGNYYDSLDDWYTKFQHCVNNHGYVIDTEPELTGNMGKGLYVLRLKNTITHSITVFVTWHKMESGRWEIICYTT